MKRQYCLYAKQNVLCSSFNNDGQCECLSCKKQECDISCEVAEKRRASHRIMGTKPAGVICWCGECIGYNPKTK